jgi:hypothetical protein
MRLFRGNWVVLISGNHSVASEPHSLQPVTAEDKQVTRERIGEQPRLHQRRKPVKAAAPIGRHAASRIRALRVTPINAPLTCRHLAQRGPIDDAAYSFATGRGIDLDPPIRRRYPDLIAADFMPFDERNAAALRCYANSRLKRTVCCCTPLCTDAPSTNFRPQQSTVFVARSSDHSRASVPRCPFLQCLAALSASFSVSQTKYRVTEDRSHQRINSEGHEHTITFWLTEDPNHTENYAVSRSRMHLHGDARRFFIHINADTASSSAFQQKLKITRDRAGILVHVRPESAFIMNRKTALTSSQQYALAKTRMSVARTVSIQFQFRADSVAWKRAIIGIFGQSKR